MNAFEEFAFSQRTPAIVYNLPKLRQTARELHTLANEAQGIACYAVKANRTPRILAEFGHAGLGADVASAAEFQAARAAALSPVVATNPGLDISTIVEVDESGGTVFFDHIEQARRAREAGINLMKHGVRLAMPGDYRCFGFDTSMELPRLMDELGFRPRKIHVHCGEIETIEALQQRFAVIETTVRQLDASVVDVGGGFGVLSNDPVRLSHAFDLLGAFAARTKVRLIFEFGKVAVARIGVLVTTVIARKTRGSTQVVVVDASPFNLGTWETRSIWRTTAKGPTATSTRIIGPTCYEHDVIAVSGSVPELAVGDRIIIVPFGAYSTSILSSLHALLPPHDAYFDGTY